MHNKATDHAALDRVMDLGAGCLDPETYTQLERRSILPMTLEDIPTPRTNAAILAAADDGEGLASSFEAAQDIAQKLERELAEAQALVCERESRLANIKFLLEPIYGSTNYAPIGGTLDRMLEICDRFDVAVGEDKARLDWLEASEADIHCDMARKWTLWANGHQHDSMPTARAAIDAARQ